MAQFSAAPGNPAIPAYPEGGASAESSMPAGYSERLYNDDLAPLKNQADAERRSGTRAFAHQIQVARLENAQLQLPTRIKHGAERKQRHFDEG